MKKEECKPILEYPIHAYEEHTNAVDKEMKERLVIVKKTIKCGVVQTFVSDMFDNTRSQEVYDMPKKDSKILVLSDAPIDKSIEETFIPFEASLVGPILCRTKQMLPRMIITNIVYRYSDKNLIATDETYDELIQISEAEFLQLRNMQESTLLELKDKAYDIASKAHAGQLDKSKAAYLNHPLAVSKMCQTSDAKIVALLHDTIEDSFVTADLLRNEGFYEYLIEAVLLLTKEKGWDKKTYFSRIKDNPIAREVKIADLKHNLDTTRFSSIGMEIPAYLKEKQLEYMQELLFLSNADNE